MSGGVIDGSVVGLDVRYWTHRFQNGYAGFEDYAEMLLRIETKRGGEVIAFNSNQPQQHVLAKAEGQYDRLGYNRLIILKARRLGMSTLSCAYLYRMVTMFPAMRARIVAQLDDTTKQLWRFIELFHSMMHPQFKLPATEDTKTGLWFEVIRSGIAVATAGSRTVGRGGTLQGLLLSEAAFYPASHEWRAGILKSVSREKGTFVAIESTANGMGNDYHLLWEEAVKGNNEFLPIFLPWYWGRDNVAPLPKGMTLSSEEIELMREFSVISKNHIAWRRLEISDLAQNPTKGGDPDDLFHQEHPSTPEEAFLYSGRPRFGRKFLKGAAKHVRSPIFRAEMDLERGRIRLEDRGRLLVWRKPNPDRKYCMSGDPAKGLSHGDNCSSFVVDLSDGATVAEWSGKIRADSFGVLLYHLGMWYNKAEAIVESNGVGGETLNTMDRMHYPKIWYREGPAKPDGKKEKSLGFETTSKSKPYLIASLDAELQDNPEALVSAMLIDEMHHFVLIDNEHRPDMPPRMEAQRGHHDDRVIARALAALLYRKRVGKVIITAEEKEFQAKAKDLKERQGQGVEKLRTFLAKKASAPVKHARKTGGWRKRGLG